MADISTYRENAIATQTGGKLIVLLYEGAVKFLRQAITELEANNFSEKGKCINKAIDIINELDVCLDMEQGGQIAQNMRALYAFMRRHLTEANIKRDPHRIRDVIALLEDLCEGWKAISP